MSKNHTVWIRIPKQKPFEILESEIPEPEDYEILIKNHAIAVNPIDSAIQNLGVIASKYPSTLGHDIAGEIIAIGSKITKFKVGDRVLALCSGTFLPSPKYSGFQKYSIGLEHSTTKIIDNWSFAQASGVSLAITTASIGLFGSDNLRLGKPTSSKSSRSDLYNQTILVWGGASSVGSSVVQLANAAGYKVVATASRSNFGNLKKLGAKDLVDYHDSDAIDQLVEILKDTKFAGAYVAAGDDMGIESTALTVRRISSSSKIVSAVVASPQANPVLPVKWVDIYLDPTPESRNLIKFAFSEYLPRALESGEYMPFPPAEVVGHGIEALQKATDENFKRTSSKKTVITL